MTIDIGIRPEEFENITRRPSILNSFPGAVFFVPDGKAGDEGRVSVLGGFPVPDVDDDCHRGSRNTRPCYFQSPRRRLICVVLGFFRYCFLYFIS